MNGAPPPPPSMVSWPHSLPLPPLPCPGLFPPGIKKRNPPVGFLAFCPFPKLPRGPTNSPPPSSAGPPFPPETPPPRLPPPQVGLSPRPALLSRKGGRFPPAAFFFFPAAAQPFFPSPERVCPGGQKRPQCFPHRGAARWRPPGALFAEPWIVSTPLFPRVFLAGKPTTPFFLPSRYCSLPPHPRVLLSDRRPLTPFPSAFTGVAPALPLPGTGFPRLSTLSGSQTRRCPRIASFCQHRRGPLPFLPLYLAVAPRAAPLFGIAASSTPPFWIRRPCPGLAAARPRRPRPSLFPRSPWRLSPRCRFVSPRLKGARPPCRFAPARPLSLAGPPLLIQGSPQSFSPPPPRRSPCRCRLAPPRVVRSFPLPRPRPFLCRRGC